jgi:hypothetical protein
MANAAMQIVFKFFAFILLLLIYTLSRITRQSLTVDLGIYYDFRINVANKQRSE